MSDDASCAVPGPGLLATLDGSASDATTQPESGAAPVLVNLNIPDWLKQWDRYEILSFLGQGGMGVVYRARDRRLQRTVALKFIRALNPKTAQRFTQEARAQARITHENICRVFEVGEVAGQTYIAMEYLPGEPLHTAQQRLLVPQKLQIIKDLAEALHAAHLQGVIHRDIKPANARPAAARRWCAWAGASRAGRRKDSSESAGSRAGRSAAETARGASCRPCPPGESAPSGCPAWR